MADDIGLYLPRTLWWIQGKSVFDKNPLQIKQEIFPMGGELVSGFAFSLVNSEYLVKILAWVNFPLLIFACISLINAIRKVVGEKHEFSYLALLSATLMPQFILYASFFQKHNLFELVFTVLLSTYAILATKDRSLKYLILFAICAGILPSIKASSAIFVIPISVWVAFYTFFKAKGSVLCWERLRNPVMLFLVFSFSFAGSTAAFTYSNNFIQYEHPLGDQRMLALHKPAEPSIEQKQVHLVRYVASWFESIPIPKVRQYLQPPLDSLFRELGAYKELKGENVFYAGVSSFQMSVAQGFGVSVIISLFSLFCTAGYSIFKRQKLIPRLPAIIWVVILASIVQIFSSILFIKWMTNSWRFALPGTLTLIIVILTLVRLPRNLNFALIGIVCLQALLALFVYIKKSSLHFQEEAPFESMNYNVAKAKSSGLYDIPNKSLVILNSSEGLNDYFAFGKYHSRTVVTPGQADVKKLIHQYENQGLHVYYYTTHSDTIPQKLNEHYNWVPVVIERSKVNPSLILMDVYLYQLTES